MSSWRFTRFQRVAFEKCKLVDTDWTSAQMKDVTFTDCDLSDAQFSQCSMERVHFSGCTLDRLKGLPSLSGASMDPTDALSLTYQLAAAMGISVREMRADSC
ncbi:pentapeptide repeat-containing protein [Streptomyces canus]